MNIAEKLTKIAENEPKVYNAGVEDGKQAEWNAFWDGFQENGSRTEYSNAFRNWNDDIFKPKYDICPIEAAQMFGSANIKDIVGCLNRSGVVIDWSQCTNMKMAFYTTNIETIPTVDTTHTTDDSSNGTFYYLFGNSPKLRSIEKIILKQSGSQVFNRPFNYTPALQEVRFEGVIGQNGLDLRDNKKLSRASIESVINALSTTTSGLTVTLSLTAVNKAFESILDEGINAGMGNNEGSLSLAWEALVNSKPNWTINLV